MKYKVCSLQHKAGSERVGLPVDSVAVVEVIRLEADDGGAHHLAVVASERRRRR